MDEKISRSYESAWDAIQSGETAPCDVYPFLKQNPDANNVRDLNTTRNLIASHNLSWKRVRNMPDERDAIRMMHLSPDFLQIVLSLDVLRTPSPLPFLTSSVNVSLMSVWLQGVVVPPPLYIPTNKKRGWCWLKENVSFLIFHLDEHRLHPQRTNRTFLKTP